MSNMTILFLISVFALKFIVEAAPAAKTREKRQCFDCYGPPPFYGPGYGPGYGFGYSPGLDLAAGITGIVMNALGGFLGYF